MSRRVALASVQFPSRLTNEKEVYTSATKDDTMLVTVMAASACHIVFSRSPIAEKESISTKNGSPYLPQATPADFGGCTSQPKG